MKYLLILPLIFFIACESSKDKDNKIINPPILADEFAEIIDQSEQLEVNLAEEIILNGATTRQTITFRGLLRDIKLNLYVLRERPEDQDTLAHLFTLTKELERIPIQARDVEFLIPFLENLNQMMLKISQYQNIRLGDLNWEIWSENFDGGAGLFTTYSEGDNWLVENRNRQGYANVRSSNTKAWLIAPQINLEGIFNPALQIDHLLNIRRNEAQEVDRELINESLKIMVSTNYSFGNPESADWEELPLGTVNLITDFNSSLSEKISLTAFEGQVVSVAAVLDLDSRRVGGHGLLWQINEFKLLGATELESVEVYERKDPTNYIFRHSFSNGLAGFEQLSQGDAALFEETNRNGTSYVKISGHRPPKTGSTLLISPSFDLGAETYSIKMLQARNFYTPEMKEKKFIQVLIGEDQESLEDIVWTELEFENVPNGDDWSPVESEWLTLTLQNKKVRIAFRYESNSETGETPAWDLHYFDIRQEE